MNSFALRRPAAVSSAVSFLRPSLIRWACVVAAASSLWPLAAQAGRPFATEDAGVLAARECELEPAFTRVRAEGVSARSTAVGVACGTRWNSQFSIGVDRVSSEGVSTTDYSLGGKTGLFGGEDAKLSATLAYGLALGKNLSGQRRVSESSVTLVASSELRPGLTGHANLGWVGVREPSTNATTWNLALEQAVGGGFDVGAEVYGDDRGDRWWGAGLRWTSGAWSWNAGAAR
jgi:hypothetical protein